MEAANERLPSATPEKPKGHSRPGVLGTAVAAFSAALLSAADSAKAQSSSGAVDDVGTVFLDDVNTPNTLGYRNAYDATLSNNNSQNRFKMLYTRDHVISSTGDTKHDIFKGTFEINDGPNEGIIIRSIGTVRPADESAQQDVNVDDEKAIQMRRRDGLPTTIAARSYFRGNYDSGIFVNGVLRWNDSDNDCGGLRNIATLDPRGNLYIASTLINVSGVQGTKIWKAPSSAPDYCQWLKDAIAQANREQRPLDQTGAGLWDRRVSGGGHAYAFNRAFASGPYDLMSVWRTLNVNQLDAHTYVRAINQTQEAQETPANQIPGTYKHLQRDSATGIWSPENPERGIPDDEVGPVWDMREFETPSGRKVIVMITGKASTEDALLDAIALLPQPDGTFREIPITMEHRDSGPDTVNGELDSDGDRVADPFDNCVYRANPDQISIPGRTDTGAACAADCDNYPDENATAPVPCRSELTGYSFAHTFGEGSALHNNEQSPPNISSNVLAAEPGKPFRYVHAPSDPTKPNPIQRITTPPRHDVTITVHESRRPDGTPGSVTFGEAGLPPVTVVPGATRAFPANIGGYEIAVEGCDLEISVAGQPTLCPPLCEPVDAGQPNDGGGDQPDGSLPDNDAGPQQDGSVPDDDGGDQPDASCDTCVLDGGGDKPDANEIKIDGGTPTPDAGTAAEPDANQPQQPQKPCGGCDTTGAAGSAILAFIAAMRRRSARALRR